MAPPLTRIRPAALRLSVIVLAAESPVTVSCPPLNVAVVAALAGTLVAAMTAAASTLAASSRRVVRGEFIAILLVEACRRTRPHGRCRRWKIPGQRCG